MDDVKATVEVRPAVNDVLTDCKGVCGHPAQSAHLKVISVAYKIQLALTFLFIQMNEKKSSALHMKRIREKEIMHSHKGFRYGGTTLIAFRNYKKKVALRLKDGTSVYVIEDFVSPLKEAMRSP